MSFFYLTPVKGDMPIHLIETIVHNRLDFLIEISKGKVTGYNEYMIEGSVYDNVGHFMLCIMSTLYQNQSFTQFLTRSETELLKRRVQALSPYDIRLFAKKITSTIKKCSTLPADLDALQVLCQHFMLKTHAQHICASSHDSKCIDYSIKVDFKMCLSFVAKRQVEINRGRATIPCGQWIQFLLLLFKKNLNRKFNTANPNDLQNDPRIMDLVTKLLAGKFPVRIRNNNVTAVLSKSVDDYVKYFPPCMRNLHLSLRKVHRLSHEQRFHYSLFLKDIGMPIDEAIEFWQREYSQSPSGSHSCCHSWDKDEKRYLYGIRHTYGLEGGRKNYISVNCARLQSTMNASSEGGCPFKAFEHKNMIRLLNEEVVKCDTFMLQINDFIKAEEYTLACRMYHRKIFPNSSLTNCDDSNFNPVKYYEYASS